MGIYFTIAFITSTTLGFFWLVTIMQLYKLSSSKNVKQINKSASPGSNFLSAFVNIFGIRTQLITIEPIRLQVRKMRWVLLTFIISFGVTMIEVVTILAT